MASASLATSAPRLALLAAAVAAAVVAADPCIGGLCSVEGDINSLLQMAAHQHQQRQSTIPMALAQLEDLAGGSRGEPLHPELVPKQQEFIQAVVKTGGSQSWDGLCPGYSVHPLVPAQTAAFAPIQPSNSSYLWWGSMEPQQPFEQLQEFNSHLTPVEYPEYFLEEYKRLRMAQTSAEAAIDVMYRATKVDGIFETIPKKLRGVFWMKGNGAPEVLAVLQYGMWSDKQKTLVVPTVPFNWAWPAGKPQNAPFGGGMYCPDQTCGLTAALVQTVPARSFSFDFLEAGDKSTTNNNTRSAYMQTGTFGHLTVAEDHGKIINLVLKLNLSDDMFNAVFTLEEATGSNDGSSWTRTCYWGVKAIPGNCAPLEFGSYNLVKVMDGDGKPVKPYYRQFLEYMGTIPVMMWTGWKDNATKAAVQKDIDLYLETLG